MRRVRLLAFAIGLASLAALWPTIALAAVSGDCAVTAFADSTGPVDVATTDVWHIQSSDTISVTGSSAIAQRSVGAAIAAFGFEIPVASASSTNDTTVSMDLVDASLVATLGRVFVLIGSSDGPDGGCSARMTVVVDDANPFTSILGIVGSAGVALGALGLLRALRSPGRRVISGLFGFALLVAGMSLVLQQTSTPGDAGAPVPVSPWAASVPSPVDLVIDPTYLAWTAALTLAVVVLLPFPADLFNSTLEHNGARIRGALRRLPLVGRLVARDPAAVEAVTTRQHPLVVVAFIVAAAALYGFLSPAFGTDTGSLLTFGGILAALAAETWLLAVPLRSMHRLRTGEAGALRVVPATLLVAAACVAISRAAGFQPGYVYGLLIGFAFARELSRADDGRAAAVGAIWLLGLGLLSWFGLGAVRGAGIEPSLAQSIATAVLAALVTAGLEGVAFGMLPLRFLRGEPLFRWSRLRWAVLYVPGLVAFALIVLNPSNGFLGGSQTPFFTAAALFLAFGAVSVGFWWYFQRGPGRMVEAPAT
jgi:hypothetical protein